MAYGCHLVFALRLAVVREFNDKNTVLCYKSDEHYYSDLAENVHGLPAGEHEYQCTANSQRYSEHYDKRVFETFELCRKYEVN